MSDAVYGCVATRQGAINPEYVKRCPRKATHGEWCRQHAESLGGWRLAPPSDPAAPPDWREVPCCFSLHEFEQRCPRTGRTFLDKDSPPEDEACACGHPVDDHVRYCPGTPEEPNCGCDRP